jgi:hypothetical protein
VAVPLLVLTNGRRSCVSRTIPSAIEHLTGVSHMVIVDDSQDPEYGQWLEDEFIGGPLDGKVVHLEDGGSYWKAMRAVWALARFWDGPAVMLLEDDFLFNEDIDLAELAEVLHWRPYLTQIALVRQPWWPNEHEHGGLIGALEAQGQTFTECTDDRHHWIEHRAVWTGNPCLIPRRTFEHDWPEGAWSEARFGQLLFANPAARGAYWGRRSDPPRVEHIGHQRVGTDY